MDDRTPVGGVSVMVADLPVRGARTPYARFGDWLAWACLAALAGLGATALLRRPGSVARPAAAAA
jgi:apolipoprotein N-acyltransferase